LNGWVNHSASYKNKLVQPEQSVSSYTTVDLGLQVQFGDRERKFAGDGDSLALYVTNIFDRAPPFVDYPGGYDGANADPIGRRLAIQLTKRW